MFFFITVTQESGAHAFSHRREQCINNERHFISAVDKLLRFAGWRTMARVVYTVDSQSGTRDMKGYVDAVKDCKLLVQNLTGMDLSASVCLLRSVCLDLSASAGVERHAVPFNSGIKHARTHITTHTTHTLPLHTISY